MERRRRFSVEQKVAVLAEATAPGANMSEIARRHGLLTSKYTSGAGWPSSALSACRAPANCRRSWRSRSPALPAAVSEAKPAAVADAPRRRRRKKPGLIEIELERGGRVCVDRDIDAAALERVLDVLARR